ncbi:MAG: polyprenyl synthetase family protein [Bacillota bacterium]
MNDWACELKTLVDEALEDVLPAESVPPELLHCAMRYAVFPGGKRIRPLLVFSAALAVSRHRLGQDHDSDTTVRRAMPCAVAVELVHSYSLIHDDLPAMDNDDYRRGRPTVHRVFGEAVGILAGDALLPLAFEVLSDSNARELLGPEVSCACANELAHAAGSLGMAGGQGIDASPPGADVSLDLVEKLADLKTGALIRASVRCGAIAAGAGVRELDALTRFAALFGRAFQVFDDLEDLGQDRTVKGRDGSEQPYELTFPGVIGAQGARAYGEDLIARAQAALSFLSQDAVELAQLARGLSRLA